MMVGLCQQALMSYKIYLVMTPGTPLDMVALKWPDIAQVAVEAASEGGFTYGVGSSSYETLLNDLRWMIFEPVKNIYNATLERAIQVLGKAPARFKPHPKDTLSKLTRESDVIRARDLMVYDIDELLGLIRAMTGVEYPKLCPFLEVPCK